MDLLEQLQNPDFGTTNLDIDFNPNTIVKDNDNTPIEGGAKKGKKKVSSDISTANSNRVIKDNDAKEIVANFIENYGFLNHVITSMNDVYKKGIPSIIINQFKIDRIFRDCQKGPNNTWLLKSRNLEYIHLLVYATSVTIHKPTTFNEKNLPSYPNECKKWGKIYGGLLEIKYHFELKAKLKDSDKFIYKDNVDVVGKLGRLPIVVKSNLCHLENATPKELDLLKENPNEDGGYIVNGENCYIIDSIERTNAFNRINTYTEEKHHKGILAFSNIISKPGISYENSFESKVIVKTTGEIFVVINQDIFTGKEIPFFIFFRLFGVSSDLDIFRYILKTEDLDADKALFSYIYNGFMNVGPLYEDLKWDYSLSSIKQKMAAILERKNNRDQARVKLLGIIDQFLLPHMGTKKTDRFNKLIFLGSMIKKTILVILNTKLMTNRDFLEEKLVQPPGVLFGDTIKKLYNKHVNAKLESAFEEKFKQANFENIDITHIFNTVMSGTKLESKLITTLSSGNGDKDNVDSRYSTQKLYTTPEVSTKNAARTVRVAKSTAHGKKSRSNAVRETRPSYATYIDGTMTHDTGDNVGKVKGLGILCIITVAGDLSLEELLLANIFPLDQETFSLDKIENKGEVHFNGKLIGYHSNIFELYLTFMALRRARKIDRFTGIHVQSELNIIDFRTDSSRLSRPFLIVENNRIKYTIEHHGQLLAKKITINDLVDMGIVEWIDNREFVYTTYVSNSLDNLYLYQDSRTELFTHCDFPCAIYGIACLTQSFADHNPDTRTAFQAKMVKQSLGVPTFEREPFYTDVWRMNQNTNPICSNIINRFTVNSGMTILLAVMSLRGHNQEDSLIANERLAYSGKFHATVDKIIEEKINTGEIISALDEENTDAIKSGNYSKLKGGKIMPGVIAEPGDILICKKIVNRRVEGLKKKKFSDKSLTYTGKNPVLIVSCKEISNSHGNFVQIQTREERPVREGDKLSSTAGQKGIISKIYPDHMMPFTSKGITPDIVMNPHGYPTRKSLGQLIEMLYSKYGIWLGQIQDYTAFTSIDIFDKLEQVAAQGLGDKEMMFDGVTGKPIGSAILFAPCYYQRIHKSIYDSHYATHNASRDAKTRQAQNGQKNGGGVKFGEMEFHACADSGSGAQIRELSTTSSDPFTVYGCRCGSRSVIVNEKEGIYCCKLCDAPSIVKLASSYTTNLLNNQIECMNVGIQYEYA